MKAPGGIRWMEGYVLFFLFHLFFPFLLEGHLLGHSLRQQDLLITRYLAGRALDGGLLINAREGLGTDGARGELRRLDRDLL